MLLAHLSDLHFATLTLSPTQFFSKRWIGNLNLLLLRRRTHIYSPLALLPQLFKEWGVEAVCISGDLTTTARPDEFAQAYSFLSSFSMPIHSLPGNHDCYTKNAQKEGRFYTCLHKKKEMECIKLQEDLWYISLDCAIATPPFYAYGLFTQEMGERLKRLLANIPTHERVMVANHFPLICTRRCHELKGAALLQDILCTFPQVKLYLHGHDHLPYVIEPQGLPLIINAGSTTSLKEGGFFLIDMGKERCTLTRIRLKRDGWEKGEAKTYLLRKETTLL